MNKIPKILHYVWFSDSKNKDFPEKIKNKISTWKNKCPNFSIMCWDKTNTDLSKSKFALQALKKKKYAFVSDYVRLKVLYEYGGIYLDTDVSIEKDLSTFLDSNGTFGFENSLWLSTAVIIAPKKAKWLEPLIQYYENTFFISKSGKINNTCNNAIVSSYLHNNYGMKLDACRQHLTNGIEIYPQEYFAPMFHLTKKINITRNTYTIHYHEGSWLPNYAKFAYKIMLFAYNFLGKKVYFSVENHAIKMKIKVAEKKLKKFQII